MAIAERSQTGGLHAATSYNGPHETGYARATVEGRVVTYRRDGLGDGFSFDYPMPGGMVHPDIMEAVILEIAAGRGEARGQPFVQKICTEHDPAPEKVQREFPPEACRRGRGRGAAGGAVGALRLAQRSAGHNSSTGIFR